MIINSAHNTHADCLPLSYRSKPVRYYIYDNFFDFVYHDKHRKCYGFQFEEIEQDHLFYLFCEIDDRFIPHSMTERQFKLWISQNRDILADLAVTKHRNHLSQKHLETDQHTGALRFDVEFTIEELASIDIRFEKDS